MPAGRIIEALDVGPAAAVQYTCQSCIGPVHDQATAGAYASDQVVKLSFDGRQVGENVGVIELQVVQHRDPRKVMDELAALVKKCGVVFVGLDYEHRIVPR